ncbi:MAG: ABC transporter substrate-binding protein [Bacteroidetes bacterium]|nr:ABC transporter substrate-binding protein [Bacteroidota bacterium]
MGRMATIGVRLLALGLAVTLLASCGTVGTSGAGTYKIGALFAITGFNSPLGTPERDTAKMMEEQINAKGGINGHKIELVIYDTESDETKAVTLAKKLLEQDNVLAIIGPSSTGESMALLDTMTKAKTPLISAAASAQIVEPVAERKYIFKTPQSDVLAVNEIFDYLKKNNVTKVALLTSSGGFGTTGKAALDKAAGPAGITFVAAETFGDKDTDMSVQLKKIQGTDAQAVVVWGTNPGPAIIAKNAKQLGLKIPMLNSHGIANQAFLDLAGDAADGVILPAGKLLGADTLPDSDPQKAVLLSYAKDFQAKYNRAPDTFGGHAYDALLLVTNALQKVGPDKEKIRDEIENTKNFVGISGVFNMSPQDHNGLTKGAFVLIKVSGGKWTVLK